GAFATVNTSRQLPKKRVWCAAVVLPMLTTCALRSPRRLDVRSATNSLSPCVGDTIAKCIAAVMKWRGGRRLVSILLPQHGCFGGDQIRCGVKSGGRHRN